MKYRSELLCILVIEILNLTSCSSGNVIVNAPPLSIPHRPPVQITPDQVNSLVETKTMTPEIKTAETIVREINNGDKLLDEGLLALRQIFLQADERAQPIEQDLDKDKRTPPLTQKAKQYADLTEVLSLSDLIADLKEGNPITNLAAILGLSVFSEEDPDTADVNSLFDALFKIEEKRHSKRMKELETPTPEKTNPNDKIEAEAQHIPQHTPQHIDALLIRFFTVYNMKLGETEGRFTLGSSVRDYFTARIENQTEEALRTLWNQTPVFTPNLEKDDLCSSEAPMRLSTGLPMELKDETFNYKRQKQRYFKEFKVPNSIQREAGAILTEYAGMTTLSALLSPHFDRWHLSLFGFLVHLGNFQGMKSQPQGQAPKKSSVEEDVPVLSSSARQILARHISLWLSTPGRKSVLSTRQISNFIDQVSALIQKDSTQETADLPFSSYSYFVQGQIDLLNSLFDRSPDDYAFDRLAKCKPGQRMNRWGELMDRQYWKVLLPYRTWLTTTLPSDYRKTPSEKVVDRLIMPQHPLTRAYFNRAMISLDWAGPLAATQFKKTSTANLIEYSKKQTSAFLKGANYYSGTADTLRSSNEETQRMIDYVRSYYKVEATRYFLEEEAARRGSVVAHSDPRLLIYNQLFSYLQSALGKRFADRIQLRASDPNAWIEAELSDEVQIVKSESYLQFIYARQELDLQVSPGIYNVEGNGIDFYVKSIQFHPLAMIDARGTNDASLLRGPGKRVRIFSKDPQIMDPWIDASSSDSQGNKDQTPPILMTGLPPTKVHHACRLVERESNDKYADLVIFPWEQAKHCCGDPQDGGDRDKCQKLLSFARYKFRPDEWKECWLYDPAGPHAPPSSPPQAPSGHNPGRISLNGPDKTAFGFPLLVALGGDGANGYHGGDSPLCENGVYRLPEEQTPYLFDTHGTKTDSARYDCVRGEDRKNDCQIDAIWPPGHLPLRYLYNKAFDVSAGLGGPGGEATAGGDLKLGIEPQIGIGTYFFAPGQQGQNGPRGRCGPPGSESEAHTAPPSPKSNPRAGKVILESETGDL